MRRGFKCTGAEAALVRHLRVTADVDRDGAPAFYLVLADSPDVRETRVVEWNTTGENHDTVLFAIDGDASEFAATAPETEGVESVRCSATDERWTYALMAARPLSTPMFDAIHRARTRPGMVVRKPVVYRDGDMHFRVVGEPAALQAALEEAPEAMDLRIDEIVTPGGGPDLPAAGLSDRQREAVEVAVELGYYDRPRGATHADVAAELGVTPSTASRHLQTAEAKLVTAAIDEFTSDV